MGHTVLRISTWHQSTERPLLHALSPVLENRTLTVSMRGSARPNYNTHSATAAPALVLVVVRAHAVGGPQRRVLQTQHHTRESAHEAIIGGDMRPTVVRAQAVAHVCVVTRECVLPSPCPRSSRRPCLGPMGGTGRQRKSGPAVHTQTHTRSQHPPAVKLRRPSISMSLHGLEGIERRHIRPIAGTRGLTCLGRRGVTNRPPAPSSSCRYLKAKQTNRKRQPGVCVLGRLQGCVEGS